jgi:hypothetical protein
MSDRSKPYTLAVLTLVSALILSCSPQIQKEQNSVYQVKIGEAIQQKTDAAVSDFVQGEIEYVALESKKEHLLGRNPRFYANDTEIIAFAKHQMYVFDRKTGEFLREIAHYGQDPGGYKKVVHSFPYDADKNLVYTSGWDPKSYYRYNTTGQFKDKITAWSEDIEADMQKSIFGEMVTSMAPLNDTCFVGYVWNINGKQKTKLILFNENNHRINTFPQNQGFEYDINSNGINVYQWEGWFYKFHKQLHFFERFTDTIYTVTTTELEPKFVLKNLEAGAPYTKRYLPNYDYNNYYFIENLFETNKFLFFKLLYQKEDGYGYYDKENDRTKVSLNTEGIANNTDDFIPFKFYSANGKDEIIGSREAYEIRLWFDENPEKVINLTPRLQKLKNIKETDNPVVMIAKLKE